MTGFLTQRTAIAAATAAVLFLSNVSALADEQDGIVVQDPHYGEVLFHFYQQDHFTALSHLVTARSQQRTARHAFEAELLEGGLLLSWGQHVEAGRIFENLLAADPDPAVRDRAWFYLGKVRYQRGYLGEAEEALESITAELPPQLQAEKYDLLARLYMDQGRFAAAAQLLSGYDGDDDWAAFSRYNTGVALVRMGELQLGAQLLDRVGTMRAATEEQRALRDRANVALGFAYLQAQLEGDARPVLQRVRLNGPFTTKALLGAGWADSAQDDYRAALASWLELSNRDLLDSAVQESLLAVPYAFAKLGAEAQAAEYYGRALDIYGAELNRLNTAMGDAAAGRLIDALLAEDDSSADGWYWQLAELPEDEQSRYLYFTIADHRFHEALKSYRDLVFLDSYLDEWQVKLDAYRDMVDAREYAYAERLPAMRERVAEFDFATLQEEFDSVVAETARAREEQDAVAVAPAAERAAWDRLLALESNSAFGTEQGAPHRAKHRILKGLLQWNMEREFRVRLWRQEKANAELAEHIVESAERFASISRAEGSLDGTVEGFADRITRLQAELDSTRSQLNGAMDRYSAFLNELALDELGGQKERLLTYRAQARFALASIYDRMSASAGGAE